MRVIDPSGHALHHICQHSKRSWLQVCVEDVSHLSQSAATIILELRWLNPTLVVRSSNTYPVSKLTALDALHAGAERKLKTDTGHSYHQAGSVHCECTVLPCSPAVNDPIVATQR